MVSDRLLHTEIEAHLLESIVDPPAELAMDAVAKFRWSSDYLHIKTLDPSKVVKVEQKVTPSVFETYGIEGEGEIVTGVNCELLKDYLQNADDDELVEFDVFPHRQRVSFSHVSGSFASIDTSTISEPDMDDLDLPIQTRIPRKVFQESHNIASMFEENLTFSVGDQPFSIKCGSDTDEITLDYEVVGDASDLDEDEPNVWMETTSDPVELEFSYEFYKHIPEFTPEGYFSVEFGPKSPMVLNCNRSNNRIPTTIVIGHRVE